MPTPDISVVLCTRNRAGQLLACLDALARTLYDPRRWELVVVDNGSTDETQTVLLRFAYQHRHLQVTGVIEQTPGLGAARNAGIAAARSPLIACTDDDCYPAPDWLHALVETCHAPIALAPAHVQYGYVGGRIELHDATDAPVTIQRRPYPRDWAPHAWPLPGDLHGANLAFRKEVWSAIGGFDPAFGPGAQYVCDDLDFVTRASLAGYYGAYTPDAVVSHHHGRQPGPATRALSETYARGRGAYYAKQVRTSTEPYQFLRQWYWDVLVHLRRGRVGEVRREIQAAASWVWRHGPTTAGKGLRSDARGAIHERPSPSHPRH